MPRQLVVIDPSVVNFQSLIDQLGPCYSYLLLSADSDGVVQLADYVAANPGFDAIHLISHGSPGLVALGSASLSEVTLGGYSAQLNLIGGSLSPGGDLLIYGCDVAQGTVGQQFVAEIARATRLDLAASMNKTGVGGDWILEYSVGEVANALPTIDYPMDLPASPFTPKTDKIALANALLVSGSSGVTIDNTKITLVTNATGSSSSIYNDPLRQLGIGPGILLTTGVIPAITNTASSFGIDNGLPGDSDVTKVAGGATHDATILEFDFTPTSASYQSISFDLLFGSDEYPEFVGKFVDCAVVMINGTNYAFFDKNSPLTVNTANFSYFRDNNTTQTLPIEYDGISQPLTILLPIKSGEVNHVKIAIADTGDNFLDSGIFVSNLQALTESGSGILDPLAPKVSITSNRSTLASDQTATLTFTLSASANDFIASDIACSGGTLSNFSGGGSSYTATFTPTPNSTTKGVVSVASNKFSDAAGRFNVDGAEANNTAAMTVDTIRPTIAVTSDKGSLRAGQVATLTFALSETATDFVASDMATSGGTLSNFSGGGTSYTATFTPDLNSTTNGVVSIASSAFSDAIGNLNVDGADPNNTVTMTVQTIRPTIAVSSDKASLAAGQTATLTFTFSEAVTDFVSSDIASSGGMLSNFNAGGANYTATFTPNANSTGNGVISVASNQFSNAAGNFNADGADLNNIVTIQDDTTRPTI